MQILFLELYLCFGDSRKTLSLIKASVLRIVTKIGTSRMKNRKCESIVLKLELLSIQFLDETASKASREAKTVKINTRYEQFHSGKDQTSKGAGTQWSCFSIVCRSVPPLLLLSVNTVLTCMRESTVYIPVSTKRAFFYYLASTGYVVGSGGG